MFMDRNSEYMKTSLLPVWCMDPVQCQPKSKKIVCKTLQLYSEIYMEEERAKITQNILKEKKQNRETCFTKY